MGVQDSSSAVGEVRQAVRAALMLEQGRPTQWRWRADLCSDAFLAAVARHRVTQVLADAASALGLPDDVVRGLRSDRRAATYSSMLQVQELLRINDVLGHAAVPWLAFKGPALAVQTTGDFSARGSGDLDVLVRPTDVERAHHALSNAGWRATGGFPIPGGSWGWRYLLAVGQELPMVSLGSRLDLHWHLAPSHRSLPTFDEAWRQSTRVPLGDGSVPTLGRWDALRHSCVNAAKDDFQSLRSLVDVHRLARGLASSELGSLSLTERRALAVTQAGIGLESTPTGLPRATRATARAARKQAAPPLRERGYRPAVVSVAEAVRRRATGARHPLDVGRAVLIVLVPPRFAPRDDPRTLRAATRATWRRCRGLQGRRSRIHGESPG